MCLYTHVCMYLTVLSEKPLWHLFHEDGFQSLERRREEIFTSFLLNPGQVTEFQLIRFLIFIVDTESAPLIGWATSLANDRIDTGTVL